MPSKDENAEPTRPATIVDVARRAGVSPATASRAFNGSARKVKEENLNRVLDAARELNYAPNASAQTIRTGGTATVALLISDVTDPYFAWIAAGVIERAEKAGMHVTVAVTNRDAKRELELVKLFRAQRPRIIVLAGSRQGSAATAQELREELEAYQATGGRTVDVSQSGMTFDAVGLGNHDGAKELGKRLVQLGYESFAILAGPSEPGAAEERAEGFRAGLLEHGIRIPDELIVRSAFSWDGGHEAAQYLKQRIVGSAQLVFAVNDMMALGVLSGLSDLGIRVPEQLALAGYDDIVSLRDVKPPLTSVRIPLKAVGAKAVGLGLRPRGSKHTTVNVQPIVEIRASTPPVVAR